VKTASDKVVRHSLV